VAELRFRVGAIFPADNETARYVMAVSIVLGDIRTALAQAERKGAAAHETLYFERMLDLHVREGLALAVTEHRDRDDVQRFVAILPDEARAARDELERIARDRSGPYADLGATDADTFRCSHLIGESGRLRGAMEELADVESALRLVGEQRRADYADLAVAHLAAGGTPAPRSSDPVLATLVTFMEHVEAAWLRPWRG
jgi:hypothetical protein